MTQKQWDKLKPATKRVKIAQDVILRIKSKQYKPSSQIWAQFDKLNTHQLSLEEPLQPLIQKGAKCECCALGGLMISRIALENKANVSCLYYNELNYHESAESDVGQSKELRTIFGEDQLALIEAAYELGKGLYNYDEKAVKFGSRFKSERGRLLAIMTNIIENKGEFKP